MQLIFKNSGILSVMAAFLFTASGGISLAASRSSATIDISVTVKALTCTPDWAGKGATVDFGKISLKDFSSTVGQVASERKFTLSLTECDASVSKVKVTATGTPDPNESRYFANNGTAKGVGLKLYDTDTLATLGNGESAEFYVANKSAEMNFSAQLVNTGGAALTTGNIASFVTLNMTYE